MNINYRLEDRRVCAYDGPECVGRVAVHEINFQWCNGICVKMAGIGGVQTKEAYRSLGIAGRKGPHE